MVKGTDKRIISFVKKIKKAFKIDKAILFGSRARGDYLEDSDYDIILVSPDFENVFFTSRISRLYRFWDYFPIEIEPLCYTPKEFERMKKRVGIVQQALKEGVELF